MALTKEEEVKELIGLHDAIAHIGCFGTRDLLRESQLLSKATDEQTEKVCSCCYQR